MARDYKISKTAALCGTCGKSLNPGDEFTAVVRQRGDEFVREDFCPNCSSHAGGDEDTDVLGVWRAKVSQPEEKKKLLVDDDLLINFFQRLEGAEDQAKINFRFVLALVLMRKKLLIYDRSEELGDGTDIWAMHFRKSDEPQKVIDPNMDEEKIADVSRSLGEIMEGDL